MRPFLFLLILFGLLACSGAETPNVRPQPEETLTQIPVDPPAPTVPEAVLETREELLRHARAGSLSGLTRIAKRNEVFVSNLGGEPHRQYWDLMRRIGVDPNLKLRKLFEEPVGLRVVDGEHWYVWPDLAARDPRDLIPEKMSFQDRKHLQELIGIEGIERLRAGEAYPGMRTAIAEDGRWVYYVLDPETGD